MHLLKAITVINNETQLPIPPNQVKTRVLSLMGTGQDWITAKIILLFQRHGLDDKVELLLNIKIYSGKFDPSTKNFLMKGEPSSSDTIIDLELGDMILDVKKLDGHEFRVNHQLAINSRHHSYFQVAQTPDGGFQQ